ncbi:MAG: PASTA domain-containing protein [Pyrinomonadaceae bacterium]
MGVALEALSALRRIGLVILIGIAFLFGLATTVYLSLRSSEVTVPDVMGKDRFEAERILGDADLNFRVRATRPSNQVKADTVLFQLPRPGEVVKAGQTVAMDISRAAKEGEASEAVVNDKKAEERAAESRNANEAANARNDNENKPKRNKNTNKNANENANTSANANAANRNLNANRPRTVNGNSNAPGIGNSNVSPGRNANQTENRRPPVAKPSPPAQNINRQP